MVVEISGGGAIIISSRFFSEVIVDIHQMQETKKPFTGRDFSDGFTGRVKYFICGGGTPVAYGPGYGQFDDRIFRRKYGSGPNPFMTI